MTAILDLTIYCNNGVVNNNLTVLSCYKHDKQSDYSFKKIRTRDTKNDFVAQKN